MAAERGSRRTMVGEVVSDRMDKTIVVEVAQRIPPLGEAADGLVKLCQVGQTGCRAQLAHQLLDGPAMNGRLGETEVLGAIVDLVGKGRHVRTVPLPEWVKAAMDS